MCLVVVFVKWVFILFGAECLVFGGWYFVMDDIAIGDCTIGNHG